MSKSAVVINGENNSEVVDFTTDANVNMVAAINDHSCPKHLESYNSKDNKSGILPFPCDFDHIYASKMAENVKVQDSNSEINHLKELLLLHLDLIQQQSEQLVTKDKQITALKQETEMLKQRLERMDRRVTLHKQKELSEVTVTPSQPVTPILNNIIPVIGELKLPPSEEPNTLLTTPLPVHEVESSSVKLETDCLIGASDKVPLGFRRKRDDNISTPICNHGVSVGKRNTLNASVVCSDDTITIRKRNRSASWNSSVPSMDTTTPVSKVNGRKIRSASILLKDGRKKKRGRKPKIVANENIMHKKEELILTTDTPYYTPVGEDNTPWCSEEPQLNGHFLEVPCWRVKAFTSCYTMEGTENLSDDVFDRRHSRLEIDERRRKRWDVQRIREQRQVEKLKQRQKRRSSASGKGTNSTTPATADGIYDELVSLWPEPDDAEYLEVEDILPVAAFGCPMTNVGFSVEGPADFLLPWSLSCKEIVKGRSVIKGRRKR